MKSALPDNKLRPVPIDAGIGSIQSSNGKTLRVLGWLQVKRADELLVECGCGGRGGGSGVTAGRVGWPMKEGSNKLSQTAYQQSNSSGAQEGGEGGD